MSFVEISSPAAVSIDFVPVGAVKGPSAGPQSIVATVVGRSFVYAQTPWSSRRTSAQVDSSSVETRRP